MNRSSVGLERDSLRLPEVLTGIHWSGCGLALALLSLGMAASWGHTHDDVFVSLRYAENLAIGRGFVFNLGEHVEGASNPLWVFLLALAHRLDFNTLLTAKVLGCVAAVATLCLMVRIGCSLDSPSGGVVASLLLAGTPSFSFWAVNGLETGFYAFLLSAGLAFALVKPFENRNTVWAVACFLLAAWTRPEGLMFGVIYLAYLVALAVNSKVNFRVARHAFIFFALVMCGGLGCRWLYFREWLPNTFFAKFGPSGQLTYMSGEQNYFVGWLLASPCGLWKLLALITLFFHLESTFLLWGFVAAQTGFIVLAPADWMSQWRFLVPIAPAVAVLAGVGLVRMWGIVPLELRLTAGRRPLVVLAGVVWAILAVDAARVSHLAAVMHETSVDQTHGKIGRWLRASVPPSTLIAVSDVGVIPYVSGLPTVDMLGLTDRYIARHDPLDGARYVIEIRKPQVLIAGIREFKDDDGVVRRLGAFPVDYQVAGLPEFWEEYGQLAVIRLAQGPYDLYIFMRKDFYRKLSIHGKVKFPA